jgi:hypothetical protein
MADPYELPSQREHLVERYGHQVLDPERLLEKLEEPARAHRVGPLSLGPPAKFAVCGDECDGVATGFRDDVDDHVIAGSVGVENRDAVRGAGRFSLARPAFENDRDWFADTPRRHSSSQLLHQRSRRSRPVPPPTSRPGSDHVRCVDEEHPASLARNATRCASRSPPRRSRQLEGSG